MKGRACHARSWPVRSRSCAPSSTVAGLTVSHLVWGEGIIRVRFSGNRPLAHPGGSGRGFPKPAGAVRLRGGAPSARSLARPKCLPRTQEIGGSNPPALTISQPVRQAAKASGLHPDNRGFESLTGYQFPPVRSPARISGFQSEEAGAAPARETISPSPSDTVARLRTGPSRFESCRGLQT